MLTIHLERKTYLPKRVARITIHLLRKRVVRIVLRFKVRAADSLSGMQRNKQDSIAYPPASSAKWKVIEDELDIALPLVFSPSLIKRTDTQSLVKKLNEWLFEWFKQQFGLKEPPPVRAEPFKARKHPGMLRLRLKKKELRRAIRELSASGHKPESPQITVLKQEYLRTVRKHNRLRVILKKMQRSKTTRNASRQFRKDPNAYAKKLFSGVSPSGSPTFSENDAMEYFKKTYHDGERGHDYKPLPGEQRPAVPSKVFKSSPPTLRDLRRVVRKKRNKATPGFNGLSYVPYKKCPSILKVLVLIYAKIWKEQVVPEEWAIAYIILLSKSEKLHVVSEFRPIALTNCDGKIFFSMIGERIEAHMVGNGYIDRSVQKGFLSGVPGCVDHSFTLWEALKRAKTSRTQIVTTWIDLANAYGSVRHNLIQYALEWYHVPEFIQKLIFNYYEKLCAQVVTKE